MDTIIDGDYSYGHEIQGTGIRQFSQVNTNDFIVTRTYVQEQNSYKPLQISTKDSVYKNAYLVEETETKREGPFVYFTRVYATIPSLRIEHREVLFTFPGSSGLVSATAWDRYARARPATVGRNATVTITYSLGEPITQIPTQITFDGAPVDFTGPVYTDDGKTFRGGTDPISSPNVWVLTDVARRWRGNIWEREKVTVTQDGGSSSFGG